MFKFKKMMGIGTLVAIVAALGISSAAFAQTPTPTVPTAAPATTEVQRGPGGPGLHSQVALAAAAKALGLTTDELSAQLWGGKTLADIATAQKVDIATVQAAVEAAEKAETKTAFQAAVTAGTLTQAKADWLITGLDKGYWGAGADNGIGFGFDMGPGGHGGRGGHGGPQGAVPSGSSTTPNSNNTVPNSTTP